MYARSGGLYWACVCVCVCVCGCAHANAFLCSLNSFPQCGSLRMLLTWYLFSRMNPGSFGPTELRPEKNTIQQNTPLLNVSLKLKCEPDEQIHQPIIGVCPRFSLGSAATVLPSFRRYLRTSFFSPLAVDKRSGASQLTNTPTGQAATAEWNRARGGDTAQTVPAVGAWRRAADATGRANGRMKPRTWAGHAVVKGPRRHGSAAPENI